MDKCSLIIFAKLPLVGEVKTQLGRSIGMKEAAEVYKQFAEHAFTLADAMKSQSVTIYVFFVPVFEVNEVAAWVGWGFLFFEQAGKNLGQRMKHAFERMRGGSGKQLRGSGGEGRSRRLNVIHGLYEEPVR